MGFNEAIAESIKYMALVESDADKRELYTDAKRHNIDQWTDTFKLKVSGVGLLTGAAGGPIGLALEAADIAYLLAACGRSCYGIGHIYNKPIDYNIDIPLILTIWTESTTASTVNVGGKTLIKCGGKIAIKSGAIAGKILLSKVAPKVAAKIGAKMASKLSTKWIPILGGAVSAGVNWWVASGIMGAAIKYYTHDYIYVNGSDPGLLEHVKDSLIIAVD